MSGPSKVSGELIESRSQLVEYLAGGCKPAAEWRIGTEHEKFTFHRGNLKPLTYEEQGGVRDLLTELGRRFGWSPILENGNVIALEKGKCNISLEPGGQLELSGAPLKTLHETCAEVHQHLREAKAIGEVLGFGLIGLGFHPTAKREDISWMPKGRYKIMRAYMPKRGKLGLDMMLRTCTVQVNLDFASEADMVKKFRVSLALQPIATALFANSPFTEGKPNGFLSYRSQVWTDTDPDRCGMLPFVFDAGMGFERYVDYLLDVPMYFVYRDGRYIDASGQSFRDFLEGKLPALPGERPTLVDWADHATTAFPEVRLKRYLEMRGADGGPWRGLCALPALWVGLLYEPAALDSAWQLVKDWTPTDHDALRRAVPRQALTASFKKRSVRDWALEVLAIAEDGLKRRAQRDGMGADESAFLDVLWETARSGRTPAERLLEAYETRWNRSVEPVFRELAY
ncbi:MAG TPA: glutamate--cysteine ligase [Alphaproteobacteria bacterium]|nr:glutamate--cysteine ligase [Alphaproteobacteria bacterium]